MGKLKVFIDSDVIISAMISKSGAAWQIIYHPNITALISNYSLSEINIVVQRLKIKPKSSRQIISACKQLQIPTTAEQIGLSYSQYTHDPFDSHIIAGAVAAKTNFIVSYNLRDYKPKLIRRKLNITMLSPGQFLQYLRTTKPS